MSLTELDVKGSIDITPYKFTCDDVIDINIPPPFQGSKESFFRYAIIGSSGSGKTSLLQSLTQRSGKNKVYNGRFYNVFIISPSIKSMEQRPKLPEDRIYTSLEDLPKILDRIENDEECTGRSLIIMDDIVSELKNSSQLMDHVKRIYYNNRHIGQPLLDDNGNQISSGAISTIILAQKYCSLPRFIRSQITGWMIFPNSSKQELNTIYDDCVHCDRPVFDEIVKRVKSKPYGFVYLDTLKSKIYNGFKKQFIYE
ncbi:NACHT domain-containing protein [bacterium]|nr:NACHT domain-containing protein [bacterium]